jgi:hypothetical protein
LVENPFLKGAFAPFFIFLCYYKKVNGGETMKVPKYFIIKASEEIQKNQALIEIYEENITEDLESFIESLFIKEFQYEDAREKLRAIKKKLRQNKKRWVESALKDYQSESPKNSKELKQEYEMLKSYVSTFGLTQFQQMFQTSSPEEFMEKRIKELKEWVENPKSLLTDYVYIRSKTSKQIKNAIFMDFSVIIGELFVNEYDGKFNEMFVETPFIYTEHPVFSIRQGNLQLSDDVVENDNKIYKYNDYTSVPGYVFRTLVDAEYAQHHNVRNLDEIDKKIFEEIMKERNENFFTHKRIYVNIGKIVKNVFKSDGIENYDNVENRIIKMSNMHFNAFSKEEIVSFGVFDYVHIVKRGGHRIAEIIIGEKVYRDYISQQVVRIYSDKVRDFKYQNSRILIFPLQRDRLMFYSNKQPLEEVYDYYYFLHKAQFHHSKAENLKMIEEILNEFIENKVTIESFKRRGDKFYIKFLPVEPYEVEDLIKAPIDSYILLNKAEPIPIN